MKTSTHWKLNGVLAIIVLILVVMFVSHVTQAEEAKVVKTPAELTQAQQEYRAQIESATAAIKVKYTQKLEALKKTLGAQGRLEEAMLVQKEITALTKVDAIELNVPGQSKAVGKWNWPPNGMVELKLDGKALYGTTPGTWEEKDGKIVITWQGGGSDELKLATAGNKAVLTTGSGAQFNINRK